VFSKGKLKVKGFKNTYKRGEKCTGGVIIGISMRGGKI
jgi:hypothetical protein